ncbi:hypothetical protein ACOBQX_02820 [Actinokineospora sp. G85]|uniref:hypothetical protein n=1 Tax=Actinokineospora sp. G85 TaxID=3406626 RepID=UPI003C743654
MIEDVPEFELHNTNDASGEAQVDQQVGAQFVESVVHGGVKIYNLDDRATPERKHKVALAYLDGGVPRRAEELLHGLIFNGHQSAERIYYYVLSVFSERSSNELTPELGSRIRDAWLLCKDLRNDRWMLAHRVVRSLVEHAQSGSAVRAFDAVRDFGRLPEERQDEITRHLLLFIDAVVEQQLLVKRKRRISEERLAGNRAKRARLFFEPNPEPPMRYQTRMALPDLQAAKRPLIGGVVAILAFAGLVMGASDFTAWGGVALVMVGCVVVALRGLPRPSEFIRVLLGRDAPQPKRERNQQTRVDKLIERCFKDARPPYAKDWPNYASGYRTRLKRRFNAQLEADGEIQGYKWLFDWHARRVAKRWPHHDRHVQPERVEPNASAWRAGGVLTLLAGVVLLLVAQRWLVLPLAAGGWFALPVLAEVVAGIRASVRLRRESDMLFREEYAEYERWLGELKLRPSDGEMARWLALDKAHLKAEAVRGSNITDQDVVTHVVINQTAPFARRASVPHGPPRYEKYMITVILLTRFGIRISRVRLDFTTGEVVNENWDVFGYDRIASASLAVRDSSVIDKGAAERTRSVRDREFRLRLLDGAEIIKVKERLGLDDTDVAEDEAEQLAVQTSGMDAAFPVLQAVALHGPGWTEYERDRRVRWTKTWSD